MRSTLHVVCGLLTIVLALAVFLTGNFWLTIPLFTAAFVSIAGQDHQ